MSAMKSPHHRNLLTRPTISPLPFGLSLSKPALRQTCPERSRGAQGERYARAGLIIQVFTGKLRVDVPARRLGLAALVALACLLVWLPGLAWAAEIKAEPDREPVRMNETFNLVFSSDHSVDGDPDFSPLAENFEILGQNQGSQFSIMNGKLSRKQEWTLTLAPKRAGAFVIPPVAFGSDRSQPARITVLEASAPLPAPGAAGDAAEVKLEVDAQPRTLYVQAQAILTVRVLVRVDLAGADLSEPAIGDALIERLGEDRRYSTSRGGIEYGVIERKYAIFPQKSGLLRIDPLQLNAQIELGGQSLFSRATRNLRVKSEPVDLKVKSIPPEFTGQHWLPAASLKLEEDWQKEPPQAKAGEPLTRTLSLRAQGATVGVLPELAGAGVGIDPSIKQYPDQPAVNEEKNAAAGIIGTRQEKTALIPSRAGEYSLPAVEVPWWNTKTDRLEIARIPPRVLKVEPSGDASSTAAPPPPAAQAGENPAAPSPGLAEAGLPARDDPWFWLALMFGLGWACTGLAWGWSRRRSPPLAAPVKPEETTPSLDESRALRALKTACAGHDPAAARQALLDWAGARGNGRRPASLAELAGLGDGGIAEEIARLNQALYGHDGGQWRGDGLWAALQASAKNRTRAGEERESAELRPLYPIR